MNANNKIMYVNARIAKFKEEKMREVAEGRIFVNRLIGITIAFSVILVLGGLSMFMLLTRRYNSEISPYPDRDINEVNEVNDINDVLLALVIALCSTSAISKIRMHIYFSSVIKRMEKYESQIRKFLEDNPNSHLGVENPLVRAIMNKDLDAVMDIAKMTGFALIDHNGDNGDGITRIANKSENGNIIFHIECHVATCLREQERENRLHDRENRLNESGTFIQQLSIHQQAQLFIEQLSSIDEQAQVNHQHLD